MIQKFPKVRLDDRVFEEAPGDSVISAWEKTVDGERQVT